MSGSTLPTVSTSGPNAQTKVVRERVRYAVGFVEVKFGLITSWQIKYYLQLCNKGNKINSTCLICTISCFGEPNLTYFYSFGFPDLESQI